MPDANERFNDVFGVTGDESIPETTSYKTYEDGEYTVVDLGAYITKDKDRDVPVFVLQGEQLVARFKLTVLDGETEVEGPPMSATYQQLILLARAFGVDVTKLPTESTTKFLIDVQDAIYQAKKKRKATVKGGWVKFVEGMNPPAEAYVWEFRGFRSHDGTTPVRFLEKKQTGPNGAYEENFAYADFAIASDMYGSPSLYNGYRVSIKVKNPFSGEAMKAKDGTLKPATKVGQKGGIPVDVLRFRDFCVTFCVEDFFSHQWQSDPEKSKFGVNEIENPLAVVSAYAPVGQRRAITKLTFNKYGYPTLDMATFIPAASAPRDLVQEAAVAAKQPTELEALYDYIVKQYGANIFEPTDKNADEINLSFTPEGIEWAKKTLVPLWTKLELPVSEDGRRYIAKLSVKQLNDFLAELRIANGENEALVREDGGF